MKKIIIQVVLLVVIVFLGWFVYQSIMEPVHFNKEQRAREKEVIGKLKDIRTSQLVFKRLNGAYSDNFDSLVAFLKVAEIPIVKIVPDPEDTTFTKTINDTVGYIKVSDTLFSRKNYRLDDLSIIPFSDGEHFEMNADTIERGGVEVHVFEVKAPYSAYLKGMDKQTIINIIAKREDIDRYPGLKVGSMTEPSTDGNWE
ncbi:MAG: hypothetical protein L3J31_09055 [Bacteroidales bacterium]|nr:hypothetical protein [Bacteroidales bacterium]